MRITDDNINTVSAVVYTACAALAAVVLFVAATAADYEWVARLGRAGWVFMLMMVILMPTVPSLLRARMSQEAPEASNSKEVVMGALVKDPVCGMEIDPASAAGSSEYEGQTIYFCNLNCKQSFDAEPEKYATK